MLYCTVNSEQFSQPSHAALLHIFNEASHTHVPELNNLDTIPSCTSSRAPASWPTVFCASSSAASRWTSNRTSLAKRQPAWNFQDERYSPSNRISGTKVVHHQALRSAFRGFTPLRGCLRGARAVEIPRLRGDGGVQALRGLQPSQIGPATFDVFWSPLNHNISWY